MECECNEEGNEESGISSGLVGLEMLLEVIGWDDPEDVEEEL